MYCMLIAQFQCNDTALKITTNFSDDVHYLHAFSLKSVSYTHLTLPTNREV